MPGGQLPAPASLEQPAEVMEADVLQVAPRDSGQKLARLRRAHPVSRDGVWTLRLMRLGNDQSPFV